MIPEEIYEIEISIIIKNNLATYEYDSFARDSHVYIYIWNTLLILLKYKRESANKVDKLAVAIMRSNLFEQGICRRTDCTKSFKIFLNFPHDLV